MIRHITSSHIVTNVFIMWYKISPAPHRRGEMCERKGGEKGRRGRREGKRGRRRGRGRVHWLAAEKCTLPSAQLGEEANVKRKDEAAKSKTSLHTHVELLFVVQYLKTYFNRDPSAG